MVRRSNVVSQCSVVQFLANLQGVLLAVPAPSLLLLLPLRLVLVLLLPLLLPLLPRRRLPPLLLLPLLLLPPLLPPPLLRPLPLRLAPLAPHLYQGMCVVLLGQAYQPRASEVFEISSTPSGAASKPSTLPASGSFGSSVFGTVGDDGRTAAGIHRRDARPTMIYHTFLFCHLHLFLMTGRHCGY